MGSLRAIVGRKGPGSKSESGSRSVGGMVLLSGWGWRWKGAGLARTDLRTLVQEKARAAPDHESGWAGRGESRRNR